MPAIVVTKPAMISVRCARRRASRSAASDDARIPPVAAVKITPVWMALYRAPPARTPTRRSRTHQQQPLHVLGDQPEVGGAVAEQLRGEQGLLVSALATADVHEEAGEHDGPDEEQRRHHGEVVVRRQDTRDDEDQSDGRQHGAHGVERARRIGGDGIDDGPAQPHDHCDDDGLEDERGPPADRRRDEATDQWTGSGADPAHPGDHAERPCPGGDVGQQNGREDVHRRDQQRRADALQDRVADDQTPRLGAAALNSAPIA